MPFSSHNGKGHIQRIVNKIKPKTALDIGCGCGTYANLFPNLEWTGVEIWEPYIERYGLLELYPHFYNMDARKFEPPQSYDIAFLGDVLEHMTAEEGRALFNKVKSSATTVIISIPLGHCPQGEWEGNPYEEHVTDHWTVDEFHSVFGMSDWHAVDGYIGVFVYTPYDVKLKIAVYAISKNEAHFVPRFCESAKEADIILIADTGSDDGLPEVAVQHGATVHNICITPWRFDLARNAALALVPRDIDVCISLDIDEVLQPGWRQEIERVWVGDVTRLRYMFDWGAGIAFYYEKIHARHGYMWHHPCHEYPVNDGRITEVWAQTDMLLAVHLPDPTKSRGQYMDLLELSVREDPDCPRNAFYYARELMYNYRWQESIAACERYLKLPRATWPNERCYAYRVMGRCYNELGDSANAEKAYMMAASEAPNTREPWYELSGIMYRQQRWAECYAFAAKCLSITNRELVYTVDPEVWGPQIHDYAAISAYWLGMKDIAVKQGMIAVGLDPNNERYKSNLQYYTGNEPEKSTDKVPNIVHMMYFMGPKSRDFSLVNYLAVKAAHDIQCPDAIYFYYNEEPKDNPHWEAIKRYVKLVKMDAPTDFNGESLHGFPQYQSDIVRLKMLYEHGGVYLDTDAIIIKPLTRFMNGDCVMAGFVGDIEQSTRYKDHSFSAATILAKPKSKFIKIWIDEFADGLKKNVWAWHVVCLPVEIYKKHPELITVVDMEKFLPFDWHDDRILNEQDNTILNELSDVYVIHMWDSMWEEKLRIIDEQYIESGKTPFAKLFKPLLLYSAGDNSGDDAEAA